MCRRAWQTRISDRANQSEKDVALGHLGGFRPGGSNGEKFLEMLCPGKCLRRQDLVNIGLICESVTNVRFERDFQRSRILVIKWLSDHFDQIRSVLEILRIRLESDY
jgi:hypothetical protein